MRRYLGLGVVWAGWVIAAAPAGAATIEVVADGLSFVPADVSINVGDSVNWTGLSFHNVAQVDDETDMTYNGGFRSGDPGDVIEFTHTFNATGTFYYICEPHVHVGMRGTVTVTESAPAVTAAGVAGLMGLLVFCGGWIIQRRRLQS